MHSQDVVIGEMEDRYFHAGLSFRSQVSSSPLPPHNGTFFLFHAQPSHSNSNFQRALVGVQLRLLS